jgi:hypothetical protein
VTVSSPSPPDGVREQARQQLLNSLGGWSGTAAAAIPPVVFVVVNAVSSLRAAIVAAVASGVVVALYRLVRHQPVQQAVTGLFSVAIAAAIAARTGQARGFFLLGIAGAFVYAGVFAVSLLVRRPLVGVLWEFLDPSGLPDEDRWYRTRPLMRAYDAATAAAFAMFAARGVVQLSLFRENRTGWLAVARLAMGYPLYIAVVAFAFWIVRRARLKLPAVHEPSAPAGIAGPADPIPGDRGRSSAGADGLADGRLGLGQRDEE